MGKMVSALDSSSSWPVRVRSNPKTLHLCGIYSISITYLKCSFIGILIKLSYHMRKLIKQWFFLLLSTRKVTFVLIRNNLIRDSPVLCFSPNKSSQNISYLVENNFYHSKHNLPFTVISINPKNVIDATSSTLDFILFASFVIFVLRNLSEITLALNFSLL